jgi:hypothetical protein
VFNHLSNVNIKECFQDEWAGLESKELIPWKNDLTESPMMMILCLVNSNEGSYLRPFNTHALHHHQRPNVNKQNASMMNEQAELES